MTKKQTKKPRSERSEVATWKEGDIEIIRKGSGGPLISEAELDRILAEKPDRNYPRKRS